MLRPQARFRGSGRLLACGLALVALSAPLPCADIPVRDRFAAALKLPPLQACEKIESLLGEDPVEDDRRACLLKLRELMPLAALPLSPDEKRITSELSARSQPVVEVLLGRFAVVMANKEMLQNAVDALRDLPPLLAKLGRVTVD